MGVNKAAAIFIPVGAFFYFFVEAGWGAGRFCSGAFPFLRVLY